MRNKIIDFIVDVLLFVGVFRATDAALVNVFQYESIWLRIGLYIIFYAVIFGMKRGVMILWNRLYPRKDR